MAVTIYRSTDVGAPALPASANYASANFYIDLIKKCLVDGYGSKSGAGWSTVYDDTTTGKRRAAFSNGNGCIEFITWGSQSLAMVIWDSITTPGVGRGFDDPFASVMSSGVNGWKARLTPAPGVATENISGMYLGSMNSGATTQIAWTVFADDKSAWVLFHYPSTHSSSLPSADLTLSNSYHSQLFFGAVKSPDLTRNTLGNFYLMHGGMSPANSTNVGTTGANYIAYKFGLRTPFNTLPSAASASAFDFSAWGRSVGVNMTNPNNSVRLIPPVPFGYNGTDTVKPAAMSAADGNYVFAFIPGLAQISESGASFWPAFNQLRAASWNLEPFNAAGVVWMPWGILTSVNNMCITDDAGWWA